jgi:hypothetical protein
MIKKNQNSQPFHIYFFLLNDFEIRKFENKKLVSIKKKTTQ